MRRRQADGPGRRPFRRTERRRQPAGAARAPPRRLSARPAKDGQGGGECVRAASGAWPSGAGAGDFRLRGTLCGIRRGRHRTGSYVIPARRKPTGAGRLSANPSPFSAQTAAAAAGGDARTGSPGGAGGHRPATGGAMRLNDPRCAGLSKQVSCLAAPVSSRGAGSRVCAPVIGRPSPHDFLPLLKEADLHGSRRSRSCFAADCPPGKPPLRPSYTGSTGRHRRPGGQEVARRVRCRGRG